MKSIFLWINAAKLSKCLKSCLITHFYPCHKGMCHEHDRFNGGETTIISSTHLLKKKWKIYLQPMFQVMSIKCHHCGCIQEPEAVIYMRVHWPTMAPFRVKFLRAGPKQTHVLKPIWTNWLPRATETGLEKGPVSKKSQEVAEDGSRKSKRPWLRDSRIISGQNIIG